MAPAVEEEVSVVVVEAEEVTMALVVEGMAGEDIVSYIIAARVGPCLQVQAAEEEEAMTKDVAVCNPSSCLR